MDHLSLIQLCLSFVHELLQLLILQPQLPFHSMFLLQAHSGRFFVLQSYLGQHLIGHLVLFDLNYKSSAFGYGVFILVLGYTLHTFQPLIQIIDLHLQVHRLPFLYLIHPLSYPWQLSLHFLLQKLVQPHRHLYLRFLKELVFLHVIYDGASFYVSSYRLIVMTFGPNILINRNLIRYNFPF